MKEQKRWVKAEQKYFHKQKFTKVLERIETRRLQV
jgi:hypothetical protein